MTVNLTFITDLASEFAGADSARVDRLVALTASQFVPAFWGDQLDLGQGYLICHMLKLDKMRGAGPLTAESAGNLSRSFGAGATRKADELDSTSYGREYKRLRLQRARGVVVT